MVIQALAFYREQDDRYGEGATLSVLANFCSMVGDYAEAREAGLEALAIFREVGNRVDQGLRLLAVGYVTMCVGLYSEALSYLEDAHTLCGNVGDPVFESRALVYIGTIYDFLGAYDRAWSYLERPLEVSVKKGGVVTRSWGLVQAGLTLIHRGEVQRALTHARRALTFLDDLGEVADHGWLPYHHVLAHLVMGQALARLGDAAGSIRAFQRGFDVDLKAGPRGTYTEVRAGLARVYLERGELEDALSQVVYILRYLEHGHLHGTMEPLRVYLTCYRVLAAGGDPRAPDMLAEGHALLQERAAKIHDAALRRSYLERVVVNRELAAIFQSQSLGAGR
jgi:tetratricopeptide (TPR) repeat protein